MKLSLFAATALFAAAFLCAGQPVPSVPPVPANISPTNPAKAANITPSMPAAGVASGQGACVSGPAWLCVSQRFQRLMFNPDGTHRPDANIAAEAPNAIDELVRAGVMKQADAPKTPITTFDEANRFVNNYPTAPSETPSASAAPATGDKPCPADQPWLCSSAPAGANTASAEKPATAAPAQGPPARPADAQANNNPPNPAGMNGKSSAAAEMPLYVLGVNDVVEIKVLEDKYVPGTYTVGPDGRLSIPLIGNFVAIGYTIPGLQALITQKLKDDGGILDPIVNVQLLRTNSKQYTLVGEVLKAGPQALLRETTIVDALSAAGLKDFANEKDIVLRRGPKEFHFSLRDFKKGKDIDKNIKIQDGDIIFVR